MLSDTAITEACFGPQYDIHGGAIALGHPLGCTGAKLCAQLMTEMQARGAKYGVESMCIGGGMGMAMVLENC